MPVYQATPKTRSISEQILSSQKGPQLLGGAGNEIRTRDTKLGKLVLYQLSYARSSRI